MLIWKVFKGPYTLYDDEVEKMVGEVSYLVKGHYKFLTSWQTL